jgi:hypothetical protein
MVTQNFRHGSCYAHPRTPVVHGSRDPPSFELS